MQVVVLVTVDAEHISNLQNPCQEIASRFQNYGIHVLQCNTVSSGKACYVLIQPWHPDPLVLSCYVVIFGNCKCIEEDICNFLTRIGIPCNHSVWPCRDIPCRESFKNYVHRVLRSSGMKIEDLIVGRRRIARSIFNQIYDAFNAIIHDY